MAATEIGRHDSDSVRSDEIARFGALAERWWDPAGPMRPLHAMNPLRVGWIAARLPRRDGAPLRILDLGCGAGLASEALADLGHDVLGIDASAEAIEAARQHAGAGDRLAGGRLRYRHTSAEVLLAEGGRFDAVVALEVIEHVADAAAFVGLVSRLLRPGGRAAISTLNRTARSLLLAKLGAEYLLRLLPVGTHEWRRFVTPAELSAHAASAGLRIADSAGMVPRAGGWRTSRDLSVNYIALLDRG
ncbi:bifunctional 2-polyprenyl-6-hydroxyphenol methylase/3-demethylubiquinol 3-O-methyltransferase UbiG [Rhizosaccharibacter radicis]|uniref:Ubiquinone biosynthesis O-methyltransferase n=1 Tax=Rhizosaccharibacter radicis TaxID=2782605 RepID=A0ABT1VWF4_9PROT|nr:bifunctional 2-polyprenyl-6-hydroxyphenol methylase/3-demethylubiquinol 3-O-methyltransferase UbiG [Acetobacteraceae bacterium KSS12]